MASEALWHLVIDGLVKVAIRERIYGVKLASLEVEFSAYGHKDAESSTSEGGGVRIETIERLFIASYAQAGLKLGQKAVSIKLIVKHPFKRDFSDIWGIWDFLIRAAGLYADYFFLYNGLLFGGELVGHGLFVRLGYLR